jgi:hypothetical protein
MKLIIAVVAAIVVLILAIATRNWSLVREPAPVDLFVTTANLSLPLLLLIGLVVVAVLYFATVGSIRMQAAIESRDLHRELESARRTADTAELSRIADMRAYLDRELPEIELKLDQLLERFDARVPTTLVR